MFFFFFLESNPVIQGAKKQSTVFRSSTEVEYRTLAITAVELAWLRMILCDLHIFVPTTLTIWCDNVSALSLASNPLFHATTKHIEIEYHFATVRVVRKDLEVHYLLSEDQLSDVFAKGLFYSKFIKFRDKLQVISSIS